MPESRTVISLEIEDTPTLVLGASSYETDDDGLLQEISSAYFWLGKFHGNYTPGGYLHLHLVEMYCWEF